MQIVLQSYLKMNYLTILFVFGCFLPFGSSEQYRECKGDDVGLVVPADVCDNSKCQKLSLNDLNMIGSQNIGLYAWNIGSSSLVFNNCPIGFNYEIDPILTNKTVTGNRTVTIRTGISCDEPLNSSVPLTGEPDPSTGEFTFFTIEEYGETWEICHPFYSHDGPFVYRACRTNPPPAEGTGFASIFAVEPTVGKCQRDVLTEFLKSYDVNLEKRHAVCKEPGMKDEGDETVTFIYPSNCPVANG